jgi:hypothetical protein
MKPFFDDSYILGRIQFSSSIDLNEAETPDFYVTEFEGKIFASMNTYSPNGKYIEDIDVEVGFITGTYLGIQDARNNGFTMDAKEFGLFDSFDSCSETMNNVWDYENDSFDEDAVRTDEYLGDALIIDDVVIDPKYKGYGLGLMAIQRTIDHWTNGQEWVSLFHVQPLQYRTPPKQTKHLWEDIDLSSLDKNDEEKHRAILMNYYKKLGFFQIGDSDYMCKTGFSDKVSVG